MREGYRVGRDRTGLSGRCRPPAETGGAWQRDRVTGRSLGNKDKIALRGQLQWHPPGRA